MAIAHSFQTIHIVLLLFRLGSTAIDPLEALSRSHGLTFNFDTSLGRFNEAYVDRLELRAANRALLNLQNNGTPTAVPDPSGFVDASDITEQLNQACASVLNLKEQLYDRHALHDLLVNETDIAHDRIKKCTDASDGSFTEGYVTMQVTGPSSTSLDIYSVHAMLNMNDDMPPSDATKFTKDFLFPVYPEHYQLITTNGIGITETWAGTPTSSYLDELAISPPFVAKE